MLSIDHLVCRIGGTLIVDDISASFGPGLLHVIVGPNGSGKSTFLKAFSGDIVPTSGVVLYDGKEIDHGGKVALARRRAVMSQLPELHFPLRVDEIVMMGRYPHFSFQPSGKDVAVCGEAMELLGISAMAGRDYLTLSGGERQRVQFARALAQIWEVPETGIPANGVPGQSETEASATAGSCRYLFLDEPVSSLDIHYQHQLLQLARSLIQENIVIVAILHDLNLALQYADRIVFMKGGRVAAAGESPAIVTAGLIRDIFDVRAHLLDNPYGRAPVIVYG